MDEREGEGVPFTKELSIPRQVKPTLEDDGERFLPNGQVSDLAFEHLHRYLLAMRFAQGSRVLDVASGEGYGCALMANVAEHVTGMDRSVSAVASATSLYKQSNLVFLEGDATRFPFADASFDLVTSFETIEHLSQPEMLIAEARRVLRSEGLLMISTPDREAYAMSRGETANPWHFVEMSHPEFKAALQRHFPEVSVYGQRVIYGSLFWPLNGVSNSPQFDRTNYQFDNFKLGAQSVPIYLVALASAKPTPALGTSIFELEKFVNPLSSLQGGISDRDAEIRRLKDDLTKKN